MADENNDNYEKVLETAAKSIEDFIESSEKNKILQ